MYKKLEVVAPFYLSGCLWRDTVFPNLATRGLRIKIELNNMETIMEAVTAPQFTFEDGQNVQVAVDGGGYTTTNGYAVDGNFADTVSVIKLKNTSDLLANGTHVLSPVSDNPAHLFQVGQHVQVHDHATDYVVSAVAINAQHIELTLDQNLSAAIVDGDNVCVNPAEQYNDMNLELNAVRMNISTVDPPKGMVESWVSKINAGKMNFDIDTYQDVSRNISGGSLNNTIQLNARNLRCKALFSVPQDSHSNSSLTDSFNPAINEPRSYNYKLYNNILVPDRLVDLSRFVAGNYNAVALREMMLSLKAGGFDVNTVRDSHKHWFLGRRLATQGYSYDARGEITLQLNYSKLDNALLMHNFLMHKRQVKVKPDGISVVY